ncbi:MAG TPA: hypothetical protein VFW70_08535 [Methylomirabilota bacterium]|nr:hypothetical protein [Methylomirabilota bacterium]
MATIPPRVLEEVYAVPPAEFTRARNARVAALAKSGHHDAAEALRKLRRPAAPLWVVNQLGRSDPEQLEAFVDAVARLRRTQLRDPHAVGDAMREQRAALEVLLEAARTRLIEHGLAASPQVLRRISSTLQGAAVDPPHADDLRHGRLTTELSAPGFEVFAGATPTPLKVLTGGKASAKEADGQRRAAERRARVEEARQQRAREAEERERLARERQAAADEAAREVEALASKLAEAKRRLSDVRRDGRAAARKPRRAGR